MMDYKNVTIMVQDTTGILKFNRPECLNAINTNTLKEIKHAVLQLDDNPSIKVIVFTGEGKSFIAGADIEEMKEMDTHKALQFSNLGHDLMQTLQNIKKPVIAAVNGYALGGGCELSISCDIIIASERATFGLPELKLGVIPGFGGTQRLMRLAGMTKAKELIFTGEIIDAEKACLFGIVNKVVPHEKLMQEVLEIARKIGERGQLAVFAAKRVINSGADMDLQSACRMEREAFAGCFTTADQKEGMRAFLEKRKPQFKGI